MGIQGHRQMRRFYGLLRRLKRGSSKHAVPQNYEMMGPICMQTPVTAILGGHCLLGEPDVGPIMDLPMSSA